MGFPERLTSLRRDRGLTQRALADEIGVHVTQLRRYEAGTSQPTLDVLRRMAVSLRVSADLLLFDGTERDSDDEELRYQFEAVAHLDPAEKAAVKSLLDGFLLRHQARRFTTARAS